MNVKLKVRLGKAEKDIAELKDEIESNQMALRQDDH